MHGGHHIKYTRRQPNTARRALVNHLVKHFQNCIVCIFGLKHLQAAQLQILGAILIVSASDKMQENAGEKM